MVFYYNITGELHEDGILNQYFMVKYLYYDDLK